MWRRFNSCRAGTYWLSGLLVLGNGPWLPRGHTGVTTEQLQCTHRLRWRGATSPQLTHPGLHFQEAVLNRVVSIILVILSRLPPRMVHQLVIVSHWPVVNCYTVFFPMAAGPALNMDLTSAPISAVHLIYLTYLVQPNFARMLGCHSCAVLMFIVHDSLCGSPGIRAIFGERKEVPFCW